MIIINQYQNGNTQVSIFEDGTKIRQYEGIPHPIFPESIDVKITNQCDLNCQYCHENSSLKGLHGNLEKLLSVINGLPAGTELAIGGGNPLSHPDLIWFLLRLKERGIIVNLTVNQRHVKPYRLTLENLLTFPLIRGLGISIPQGCIIPIDNLDDFSSNIVFHVIAGIHPVDILKELTNKKVLVLGYKFIGRGDEYYDSYFYAINNILRQWQMYLSKYFNKMLLSFDNLSIKQLVLKRYFTDEGWNKFYMGNDFEFSMYLDAVNESYGRSSMDYERVIWSKMSLINYFNHDKRIAG